MDDLATAVTPHGVLLPDFKETPYWWEAAPPQVAEPVNLASSYDVVIVGAGVTGLSAALTLLRAGASVAVLDRDDCSGGASSRNAGFLGRVLKKSFLDVQRSHGLEHAKAIYGELNEALQFTLRLIEKEGIECNSARCGRFIGSNSERHHGILLREFDAMEKHLGLPYQAVPRDEQRTEFASNSYYGGFVVPDLASLHPGLYHSGLRRRVQEAGGTLATGVEVMEIVRGGSSRRLTLRTARGSLGADAAIVATNGYTTRGLKWHARRVVPFTGYMAATEKLSPNLLTRIIPNRRTVLDTKTNIDFFRPAPDSSQLLFGGSTGRQFQSPIEIAERLHSILRRVLPELSEVRLSHVWQGQCAGTFDMLPHIGEQEGVWYGLGYNFAGVPMGTYFGHKIANQILKNPEGETVFSREPLRSMPFYNGSPWFVPYVMRYFDWKDNRTARRRIEH